MGIQYLTRKLAFEIVFKKIIHTDTVLDIGCGIRPQFYFKPRVHVCVEPHLPYLERLIKENPGNSHYVILNCTWAEAMALLPDKSFDTVFMLDMIEHMEKSEGVVMLEEAERVARKQIIVFTPLGYMEQNHPDGKDRWGMDGGYWQTHRSGWTPEDFGEGWDFIVCEDFHKEDQHGKLEKPFGAFWAIRTFENQSDPVQGKPVVKRVKLNVGIARNMLLRSLFLMSLYQVAMVAYMFFAQAGFRWWYLLAAVAIPLWWVLDFFFIWRQEVDANFQASGIWQKHEQAIDDIKTTLEEIKKRIGE